MHVLVTNDDGIASPALAQLKRVLTPLGRVTIVAPDRNQSATSQALTLHRPLRIHTLGDDTYSVDGTPKTNGGPSWKGIYGHPVDITGGPSVMVDDNYIIESIINPGAKVVATYPNIMPTFKGKLSDHEIRAIIAYIKSLEK